MSDVFKKVRDGEKIRIPARTYNAMVDAAQDYIKRQTNLTAAAGNAMPSNMVYIKNISGSAVDKLNVLGISGSVFDVSTESFKQTIILKGVAPLFYVHNGGRFVITAEPIANNSIGLAYVSGVCAVQIDVQNASHAYADVSESDVTKLKSVCKGTVGILYKESGTGVKWAIVRFGASGGMHVRKARLTADAGDGDTITATLYDEFGNLAEDITVHCEIMSRPGYGSFNLSECLPRLQTGAIIYVAQFPDYVYGQLKPAYNWHCISAIFYAIDTTMFDVPYTKRFSDKLRSCS